MVRGDILTKGLIERQFHSLLLDSLCISFTLFGETHKNVDWSAREPMVYSDNRLVEGPDLVIVYRNIINKHLPNGIPVELKTGNVNQRDIEKAQHQLWMGAIWLEQKHGVSVPYGVLVKGLNNGKVKWERIDYDKLRLNYK